MKHAKIFRVGFDLPYPQKRTCMMDLDGTPVPPNSYNRTVANYSYVYLGHFTQMIWKDSMQLGCAVAVAKVQRGSFEYSSTYTVAHYAPSGNVHYPTTKLTIKNYQKNVPLPKAGIMQSVTPYSPSSDDACSRCILFSYVSNGEEFQL